MTLAAGGVEAGADLRRWVEQDPRGAMAVLARNDAEYFLNTFCKIRNFQLGTEAAFSERPIQRALRELISAEKLVVAAKAREVGWTWELALLSLWEAWHFAPYQCIYLCQREDNAEEFIRRIRWAAEQLPDWLGFPPEEKPTTKTRFAITVDGKESEVLAFPSVPTAIESWHPRRVIADQWGLIPDKVLPSALGAIGLDGYFVGLDTSQGLGNEFANVYLSARDGHPELYAPQGRRFHSIFATWRDNPSFDIRPSGGTRKDTERMYPENDREAFSLVAPGTPVYPEFRAQLHVAKEPLRAMVGLPIFVGVDWGNCYSADTEVLTEEGWKQFPEVRYNDRVATLNPESFALEYTRINFKVSFDYAGKMLEFTGKSVNALITPEHILPYTRRDTPKILRFDAAARVRSELSAHRFLQLTAKWEPEWKKRKGGYGPLGWSADVYTAFMGIYLSEGCSDDHRVSIAQSVCHKGWQTVLDATGLKWKWDGRGWRSNTTKLARYLRPFGKAHEKRVPAEIKAMPAALIQRFIQFYTEGDGKIRDRGYHTPEHTIFTVSDWMADDMQELALKAGWHSYKAWVKPQTSIIQEAKGPRTITNNGGWSITFRKKAQRTELLAENVAEVDYQGMIYCLNVPYHTLYVRRNGLPHWNGNTPAAVCYQIGYSGEVRVLAEFQEMQPGVRRFGRILLDEFAQRWPGFQFIWWGDPSGRTARDSDGKSCFQILREDFGIHMNAGLSQWTKRREAVAHRLTTLVDGEPGMIVDPSCELLIAGFMGQYHFPERKDEEAYANFEATRGRERERMLEHA